MFHKGITQRAVVKAAGSLGYGLDQPKLSNILRGNIQPYPRAVEAIIAAFGYLRPNDKVDWSKMRELQLG